MNDVLNALIFDRVQADVDAMTKKAYIDYDDLNRIGSAIQYVSDLLNRYGYRNTVQSKEDWIMQDRRTDREMERLRQNIETLRSTYFTKASTPLTPDRITYTSIYEANAIEKIIFDIGSLIEVSFPGHQHLAFKIGTRAIGNRSIKA